jgi:hypothetical protein
VNVLRAADETDRRHAEAVRVERLFRRCDERRVISETEIVISAHVEHAPAARDFDLRILRRDDDAFRLVEALRPDFGERVGESLVEFSEHDLRIGERVRIDKVNQRRDAGSQLYPHLVVGRD